MSDKNNLKKKIFNKMKKFVVIVLNRAHLYRPPHAGFAFVAAAAARLVRGQVTAG